MGGLVKLIVGAAVGVGVGVVVSKLAGRREPETMGVLGAEEQPARGFTSRFREASEAARAVRAEREEELRERFRRRTGDPAAFVRPIEESAP